MTGPKGTEHFRQKAQTSMEGWADCYEPTDCCGDVLILCGYIDAQAEVVEAARALISAMTGDKRYRDDLLEQRCFEALRDSLNALEEEFE